MARTAAAAADALALLRSALVRQPAPVPFYRARPLSAFSHGGSAARNLATSTRTAARIVSDHRALAAQPLLESRRSGEDPTVDAGCAGSAILDALDKARAHIPKDAPWWWKVAKAKVQAQDRSRDRDTRRPFFGHARPTPTQHIFARAAPSASSTHECHHSHDDAHDQAVPSPTFCSRSHTHSQSSGRRSSSADPHDHTSCGGDSASCASPVSGCRASSHGWSWWYLALNERRRRDPAKRAHLRHACREWPGFNHAHGRGRGPRACRREWRERCDARDRYLRSVRALVLQHRVRARTEGTHSGSGQAGPFDYESFRSLHWADVFRCDRHRHHRHGYHRNTRARKPRWMYHHVPQEWVRHAHRFRARKSAVAYFTWRGCDSAALRIREGGAGAARIDLGRPPVVKPGTAARAPSTVSSPLIHWSTARFALRAGATAAARAFSTSSTQASPLLPPAGALLHVCTPLELGLPLLLPLASVLKSSAALSCLSFVTRISLTLLPLSARSRILHSLRERYLRDPTSLSSSIFGRCALEHHARTLTAPSGFLARWNALLGLPLLILTPLVLLALVALASLERTPITGRWRVVMLSPAEEADLVGGVLAPTAPAREGTSRDWVAILRRVLALPDEGASLATGRRRLLGGDVLDPRDWRVRWAEAVLRALERGGAAALAPSASSASTWAGGVLAPPPTAYPLEPRPEAHGAWSDELVLSKPAHAHPSAHGGEAPRPLRLEYDLLVVDRPDANAFSFGFGPDAPTAGAAGPRRGVIVVYTGFLDEILDRAPAAGAHLAPDTLPTDKQTKALAVLLSHELAHLALSHTLESYASTSLSVPHLARLTSDVLRTVLYPVTALFGPFFNDAIGGLLGEGAQGGFGVLGQAVNSCQSRTLESEADVVALRLLASSGIDPHFALSFWEDRIAPSTPSPSSAPSPALAHTVRPHSAPNSATTSTAADLGLFRSHPVDEERVARIRDELAAWERWWARRPAPAAPAPARA